MNQISIVIANKKRLDLEENIGILYFLMNFGVSF